VQGLKGRRTNIDNVPSGYGTDQVAYPGNRIITVDQNVILESNYEGKTFKNHKYYFLACGVTIELVWKALNMILVCCVNSDPKWWIDWKYAITKCPNFFDVCVTVHL